MTPQLEHYEYKHSVTSENTAMHWILYAMDAWESQTPEQNREQGCKPVDVWEYATDREGESIVFRGAPEIRHQMKVLATERDALDRRTDETGWVGSDVDWYYRLNEQGRKALLDLGVPQYLPNRRDPEHDRALPMEPSHQPGWWLDDDDDEEQDDADSESDGEQSAEDADDDDWDINDNDWIADDKEDGLFFKSEADALMSQQRAYDKLGRELAEAFPEATFVLTCGPYRPHDMMYRIRDPFKKVIQIDVYSPMALHRGTEEIQQAIEQLARDLHEALETVSEEYDGE